MMAPKLRFSRCLKEKAPDAVACTARVLTPTSRSSAASAHRLNTRSNDGEGEEFFFFFLPSMVFQVYDCYFTSVLTQRSCFEVLLTADSQCFTSDDPRIFVPTIPRWRRAFTVSWNIEVFVHSNSASSVVNFFPTRRPRHQFPLPANLHRHSRRPRFQQDETRSLLDRRRHESIQTYSSCQLVSHLGTSTTLFPAIWTKTARSIEELFSQSPESKQQSTNWRRRHLGHMQQQPRRWPGLDKCVETKLRLDVYIMSLATGMVVFATYINVPWQWTG